MISHYIIAGQPNMDSESTKVHSLSDERYLAKHHVFTYIQDAIGQLLQHRETNPQVVPAQFLNDYFQSVIKGNHTLFREYSFIHETPRNRASFIATFWKCFKHIGSSGDLLSVKEYHSLLSLICYDFPYEMVQKAARIVLMEDAMDCLMSFTDFLYAFQLQFFYEEFLGKCGEIYEEIASGSHRPGPVVVVPTSDTKSKHRKNRDRPASQDTTANSVDGIDALSFYDDILHVIVHNNVAAKAISIPPAESLKLILTSANRVTFYGFLMALAKSDLVNQSVGEKTGAPARKLSMHSRVSTTTLLTSDPAKNSSRGGIGHRSLIYQEIQPYLKPKRIRDMMRCMLT